MAAGNVAYNLLKEVGGADGDRSYFIRHKTAGSCLQLGSSVRSIINMANIAVVDAQQRSRNNVDEIVAQSPWWNKLKKNKRKVIQ